MFPNAKFIYPNAIHTRFRESTRSFFSNTIKPLQLQDFPDEQLVKDFVEVYRRLFYKFEGEVVDPCGQSGGGEV